MKLRMSPTVCVRFILHTMRVPSARRTCTLVVGSVWSTSNRVLMLSAERLPSLVLPLAAAGAAVEVETGKLPGISTDGPGPPSAAMDGTGEPRRWPAPENALRALGDGTKSSVNRFTTRSSTGWPGATSRMCGGARLCKLISANGRGDKEGGRRQRVPGVDLVEDLRVGGVVVAHEVAVLDAEPVAPES